MMKAKILIFGFLIFLFTGCSKDNDTSQPEEEQETEIPANEKLLNDINGQLTLEYNTDGKIERIKYVNALLLIYGYEGGNLKTLDVYGQDENLNYIFNYDANGHIASFSEDDVITDVTYNEANKYYLYKKENGDEFTFFINAYDDINKIMEYDKAQNETKTTTILYEDGEYNGTLTNTNNPIIQTILALPEFDFLFLVYSISKKPVRTIAGGSIGILDFQNSYDEQSFLETSIYDFGQGPVTLNFNYTKLKP